MRNQRLESDPRLAGLLDELRSRGCTVTHLCRDGGIGALPPDTDFLLSVGGDGTFLSASSFAAKAGVPVVGVNLGRLGFLSENRPEVVADALLNGRYSLDVRTMLQVKCLEGRLCGMEFPPALNEVTVHRIGAAMLGVDVTVDGKALPTYWADGLLIATSSGSTAYSLSAGGPIVMPESKVLIISPIAPHNLNVRPLIVPDTSEITLGLRSRDDRVNLTMDNRTFETEPGTRLSVSMAQFSLKRVRLDSSDFINALTEKLFWGEDIRNSTEQ
ncbi:MAG: NAD(+)/NADH kinase [Candidatus Cryptobacteroides sp.]